MGRRFSPWTLLLSWLHSSCLGHLLTLLLCDPGSPQVSPVACSRSQPHLVTGSYREGLALPHSLRPLPCQSPPAQYPPTAQCISPGPGLTSYRDSPPPHRSPSHFPFNLPPHHIILGFPGPARETAAGCPLTQEPSLWLDLGPLLRAKGPTLNTENYLIWVESKMQTKAEEL